MSHFRTQEPAAQSFAKATTALRTRHLALLVDDSVMPERVAFVAPAQNITPEVVNEILTMSGGLTFVAVRAERARSLLLERMTRTLMEKSNNSGASAAAQDSSSQLRTMCTSVEAREGVTTGISASDRAKTIAILGDTELLPRKLVRPGHIFPVETLPGGALVKNSVFEAAVDLVTASGFTEAAVVVDALDPSGNFLSLDDATSLAKEKAISVLSVSQLIRARLELEHLVVRVAEAKLPTRFGGELKAVVYRSQFDSLEHIALVKGQIENAPSVLVRVQPELTFGDIFDSRSESTRNQIDRCLAALNDRPAGVFVYLRRPFKVQFGPQLNSRSNSDQQHDQESSPPVDTRLKPAWMMREYGLGAQILRDLGVTRAEVLTGTTRNLVGINSFGIEIVGQLPIPVLPQPSASARNQETVTP